MRRFAVCCGLALLVACAKSEQQDHASMASISLNDVAGTWNMKTMASNSDSVLVAFDLVATADTTGWMYNFPGRAPEPVRVLAVAGDSIVTHTGPYASVLRPGVQVTVHSVVRLQDGKIVGTSMATYSGGGPDSVITLRTEGTRAP